jgi:cyclopropane fatty-acyl-phospholipid synthase-like methyltransferase
MHSMIALARFPTAAIPIRVRESQPLDIATQIRASSHNAIYTRDYYANSVESAALQSADVMARSIFECFHPQSLIDLGCGTGALLEAFRALGCEMRGLEYSDAGLSYCRNRGLPVEKFNIETDRLDTEEHYDVAVSFEVAEHLPHWIADRFVELLRRSAPAVVMSAATPGQGGHHHVNEQPHTYWIEKFHHRGYVFDLLTSVRFSSEWRTSGAAYWYYDNVMVFRRR